MLDSNTVAFSSVYFDSVQGKVLFNIWLLSRSGLNWTASVGATMPSNVSSISSMAALDANTLIVVGGTSTDRQVWLLARSGQTWAVQSIASSATNGTLATQMAGACAVSTGTSTADVFISNRSAQLLRMTMTLASSWTLVSAPAILPLPGLPTNASGGLAIACPASDPRHVYVIDEGLATLYDFLGTASWNSVSISAQYPAAGTATQRVNLPGPLGSMRFADPISLSVIPGASGLEFAVVDILEPSVLYLKLR